MPGGRKSNISSGLDDLPQNSEVMRSALMRKGRTARAKWFMEARKKGKRAVSGKFLWVSVSRLSSSLSSSLRNVQMFTRIYSFEVGLT